MHCHKILVVEDDDAIRTTLVELLALEGYEVVPAHHGKEALELLRDRKEDPCLVITDLMMPKMDGWELMRCLEEQDVLISIPVIVMTASESTHRGRARQLIKKPFNLDTVVELVRQHCGLPNDGPVTKSETSL
jgi:CheY-like chemotaxis protein